MSTLLPKRNAKKTVINIIPLVDVLIVLIFFFLMTMQFRHQNILHITPPKAQTAGPNKMTQEILIGIDQAGQYFYNDTQVSSGELEQALSIAGQADGAQSVLVLADEESPLKHMTYVMDVSRKSGLEKVRLQTRQ